MAANSRGGRPSKGERKAMKTRPPVQVAALAEERAAALGMPVSDFIANAMAAALGLPAPFPPQQDAAGQLKLTA